MNQLTIASHNHKIQMWINRIQECRTSSQRVSDWCADNNISIKSYYYWMRKMKSEAFEALPAKRKSRMLTEKTDTAFAEVKLVENPRSDACAIKLHVGDLLLEFKMVQIAKPLNIHCGLFKSYARRYLQSRTRLSGHRLYRYAKSN